MWKQQHTHLSIFQSKKIPKLMRSSKIWQTSFYAK